MVICICFHVTEKQITDLLPLPLEEVMLRTNAGMCCGQCMTMLGQVVKSNSRDHNEITPACGAVSRID